MPIGQRQLFAFAREQYHEDFAEWVERLKCRLVRKGFAYPDPERLGQVLLQIAKQRARAPEPSTVAPPDARGLTRDEARTALAQILERTGVRLSLQSMPPVERRDERRIRLVLQIAQEIRKRQEPGA
jgi:hypothetical protein